MQREGEKKGGESETERERVKIQVHLVVKHDSKFITSNFFKKKNVELVNLKHQQQKMKFHKKFLKATYDILSKKSKTRRVYGFRSRQKHVDEEVLLTYFIEKSENWSLSPYGAYHNAQIQAFYVFLQILYECP